MPTRQIKRSTCTIGSYQALFLEIITVQVVISDEKIFKFTYAFPPAAGTARNTLVKDLKLLESESIINRLKKVHKLGNYAA